MRILIASSKNWFNLKKDIQNDNEVKLISKKDELSLEFLNKFNPELIFFPHWNWVVSEEIYSQYKCIVFHTAPLPYGRGGSPIQNLILNEIKEAPVCALKMTSELDSGPIYTKRTISLDGSLHQILKKINTAINIMIEELIINLPEPKEQVGEVFTFERLSLASLVIIQATFLSILFMISLRHIPAKNMISFFGIDIKYGCLPLSIFFHSK